MASGSRLRAGVDFDLDTYAAGPNRQSQAHTSLNRFSILGELPLGNIENKDNKPTADANIIDTLTAELEKLHIGSNHSKENHERKSPRGQAHRRTPAPDIREENRVLSGACTSVVSHRSHEELDNDQYNALAIASRYLPSNQEQLTKHQEATRVESDDETLVDGVALAEAMAEIMSPIPVDEGDATAKTEELRHSAEVLDVPPRILEVPSLSASPFGSDVSSMDHLAPPPASRPPSRIEDSVEALDKLEEEIEALDKIVGLERVLSPDATQQSVQDAIDAGALKSQPEPPKRSASVRNTTNTVRVRTSVERSSSVRKSSSAAPTKDEGKAGASTKPLANASARKSMGPLARPASLLAPKAPAKSSKPPTVPAFELPGEAVARRLKEQREARRSRQITPEEQANLAAAFSPSKPHAKSTKPPTRPTFELPGEAISRRKREEREARLKAQEEEEKKRREFKARPIRASLAPSNHPRETTASRARQKAGGGSADDSGEPRPALGAGAAATATSAAKKRHSIATITASTLRASLAATQRERGRRLEARSHEQEKAGRSTSAVSTTGSTHEGAGSTTSSGKRSTVSSSEAAQQKLRGREIWARDNSVTAEREREREEKKLALKAARLEAAERSRAQTRMWAAKKAKESGVTVKVTEV